MKEYISFNLILIFIIFGGLFLVFLLFDSKLNHNAGFPSLLVTVIIICFTLGLIGSLWGGSFTNPLFYPEGVINGYSNVDTLFHTSITNMIKTYNIPSTGIDGLIRMSYHVGSHWIFAQFCKLLDIGALNFYQVGYSIIFFPLFLKAILMTILDIKFLHKKEDTFEINKDFVFWSILSFGFLGLIPKVFNLQFSSYLFIGESYLVSLTFTFLFISCLIFFENEKYPKRINWLKNIFFIAILPIFIGAIGFCKVSLMVILLPVLLYLFFRKKYYRKIVYIISVINTLIVSVITFFSVSPSSSALYGKGINLSIRNLIPYGGEDTDIYIFTIIIILTSIFFWSVAFIILKTISLKKGNSDFLNDNFALYKTLEIEIIIIISLTGILPPLLLNLYQVDSTFYEIQRWFALIFILGSFTSQELADSAKIIIIGRGLEKRTFSFIKYFLITILTMVLIFNSFYPMYKFIKFTLIIRQDTRESILKKGNEREILLAKYKLIDVLEALETMPISEKKKTVVYVPQSNKIYWDHDLYNWNKIFTNPFLVPAVTGIAMIDGMPEFGCDVTFWGYSYYKPRQNSKDYEIKTIYEKALDKGFVNLIIIYSKDYELSVIKINPDNINEFIN